MSGFDLAVNVQICVLGETVGKSSLINRFLNNSFSGQHIQHKYMETIHTQKMKLMNQTFELKIIDTTNNEDEEILHDDILQIEWKGMDGYSMDVRKKWLIESDVLFILFNRLNRISWMILQAIHGVTCQCLEENNTSNIPIYIVSTCSDLYLSQSSLSNLDSIDLVSVKEVEEYIAKYENVFHYQTSAKVGHNIDTLFKAAIAKYDELHPRKFTKMKKRKRKRRSMTLDITNKMNQQKSITTSPSIKNAEPLEIISHKSHEEKKNVFDFETDEKEQEPLSPTNSVEIKSNSPSSNEQNDVQNHQRPAPEPISKNDDNKSTEEKVDDSDYVHLMRAESPLSSEDIYNIEYSSKYKESMEFRNIKQTFTKYHQIKVSYAQIEESNPEYKSSSLLFFKDLDATLTTIGCIDSDKKIFFIQCRQQIIFKMIDQINIVKHTYKYLAKITLLSGPLPLRLDELQNNNYWNTLSDVCFITKLEDISYEEWMKNSQKSEIEFKNEISGALHINPVYITINGVGKGLNDIIIDWKISYIWIPYYVQGANTSLIRREYRMRPQDQIEVKYKNEFIPCTVLEVSDTLNAKGKKIKIRYNKKNGNDRFKTRNSEWMWTIKEYERLRLPDHVYVIVSYNGVKIGTTFKPPLLAFCRNGNKELIDIGHHIFVKRNNLWYRCEVIASVLDGKKIKILYLVNTFVKNTEWLRLWEPTDLKRISLDDMRT